MIMYHEPALLMESVDALMIKEGGIYVDATYGGGGHSKEILKRLNKGKLFAFDQDADALKNAISDKKLMLIQSNFRYIRNFLRYHKVGKVNGVLADLGISSHQIDVAERGFSTRFDADLDMRMNRSSDLTAAGVINNYSEEQLASILFEYGEIRNSKSVAAKIVRSRNEKKIKTSRQLIDVVRSFAERGEEQQFLARVFQAIRIEVNRELDALKELLMQCKDILEKDGRLAVISYHSLEDRLVKNFMAKGTFSRESERDEIYGSSVHGPFRVITKKPIVPGEEEINRNPRSRSAKLRIAEKI
jgi:16S rRNA (cytosine1402-N4)-methyltransferase